MFGLVVKALRASSIGVPGFKAASDAFSSWFLPLRMCVEGFGWQVLALTRPVPAIWGVNQQKELFLK